MNLPIEGKSELNRQLALFEQEIQQSKDSLHEMVTTVINKLVPSTREVVGRDIYRLQARFDQAVQEESVTTLIQVAASTLEECEKLAPMGEPTCDAFHDVLEDVKWGLRQLKRELGEAIDEPDLKLKHIRQAILDT